MKNNDFGKRVIKTFFVIFYNFSVVFCSFSNSMMIRNKKYLLKKIKHQVSTLLKIINLIHLITFSLFGYSEKPR